MTQQFIDHLPVSTKSTARISLRPTSPALASPGRTSPRRASSRRTFPRRSCSRRSSIEQTSPGQTSPGLPHGDEPFPSGPHRGRPPRGEPLRGEPRRHELHGRQPHGLPRLRHLGVELKLDGAEQKNLIITPHDEPEITVDNLEVAQFIYLLLNNERSATSSTPSPRRSS